MRVYLRWERKKEGYKLNVVPVVSNAQRKKLSKHCMIMLEKNVHQETTVKAQHVLDRAHAHVNHIFLHNLQQATVLTMHCFTPGSNRSNLTVIGLQG